LTSSRAYAAVLTAVLLAGTVLGTGGCAGGGGDQKGGAVDQVTFLTGLGSTGREGYGYVADAKGYFADEHIRVTIKPGAAGDSNLQVLAARQAQFIAIDYAGAVVRAGTGKFDGVRAVAVLQQKTTIALMTLESSGIRSPRDLVGKTVAQPAGAGWKRRAGSYPSCWPPGRSTRSASSCRPRPRCGRRPRERR
jgi:NitT/TauT family transport system substrate-binding protein